MDIIARHRPRPSAADHHRHARSGIVPTVAIALLLTACGSPDATDAAAVEAPPSPAAAPAEATTPAPTTPPLEEPTATATLRPAAAEEPTDGVASEDGTEPEAADDAAAEEPGPGTPQQPVPGVHSAGTITVTAELCTVEGATFEGARSTDVLPDVEVIGEALYAVDAEERVLRFDVDTAAGCHLVLDPTWGEDGVHTTERGATALSRSDGARLVASGNVFASEVIDTETGATFSCQANGGVEIRPDGQSGFAFFTGSALEEVTFADTSCTIAEAALGASLPFALGTTAIAFVDDLVLTGGLIEEGEDRDTQVIAYDAAGVERWRQGAAGEGTTSAPDRYGWVHGIATCGQVAICTIDTNFKRMQILDTDGTWLTSVDLRDLHGVTGSSWWQGVTQDDQGRLWMPVGASRVDGDGADGFVYLVTVEGI